MANRGTLTRLATELTEARDAFFAALEVGEPRPDEAAGPNDAWSVRELIAHLGYWAGHAAEALHHAAEGRTDAFGEEELDVEERNQLVARVARTTDPQVVRQREAATYQALLEALRGADPAWLDDRVRYGDTLAQVIRDDGIDHYREHAADIAPGPGEAA